MDGQQTVADIVKELHDDLARKYRKHGNAIINAWRSFSKAQRTLCLKAGTADGVVLKHSTDPSLGSVYKFMPEWNIKDITDPDSDFLLDLLKHRATTSLMQQYSAGIDDDSLGDLGFIQDMMQRKNLRHVHSFKHEWLLFQDDDKYGDGYQIIAQHNFVMAALDKDMKSGKLVSRETGELILQRQMYLLQSLNIMIEDILDQASIARALARPRRKQNQGAGVSLPLPLPTPASSLTVAKLTLTDIIESAEEKVQVLEAKLALMSVEPVVITHAVNVHFFSRPELVPDEKGRRLPVHTDRYISSAFFEAVDNWAKELGVWKYILRLLYLLNTLPAPDDKVYKAILLQEISNVSNLEYSRIQNRLKRQVQSHSCAKFCQRVSNSYDQTGLPRVTIKKRPEELTRSDPQLHYLLRLCRAETNSSDAAEWTTKLNDLYESHPAERERLVKREHDVLCDFAFIVGFLQDLSRSPISLPTLSRKTGQAFITLLKGLEVELNEVRKTIDLRDYVVPIDNLLEPGVAEGALTAMDQFIRLKAGSSLEYLYEDVIEDSIQEVHAQNQRAKAKLEQRNEAATPVFQVSSQPPTKEHIAAKRREKEKSRPPHSSFFKLSVKTKEEKICIPKESVPALKVTPSTYEVFQDLFDKSRSRGSVSWSSFQVAMSTLGFSIIPKFGSVFTFNPPESLGLKRSFTVHRPHGPWIEGYMIPTIADRLKRVYGWDLESFQSK